MGQRVAAVVPLRRPLAQVAASGLPLHLPDDAPPLGANEQPRSVWEAWWLYFAPDTARYKPRTLAAYRRTEELSRGPVLGSHPTAADAADWLSWLRAQFPGTDTATTYFKYLRAAYECAREIGLVTANPFALVTVGRARGRPHPLQHADAIWPALMEACGYDGDEDRAIRRRAMLVLMRRRGLRRGEVLGLTARDVNVRGPHPVLAVRRQRSPGSWDLASCKTQRAERQVVLRGEVAEHVRAVLDLGDPAVRRGFGGGVVERSPFLFPFTGDQLGEWMQHLRAAAPAAFAQASGAGPKAWHIFRDTFACEMYEAGAHLSDLSSALGHTSEKVTTEHYLGVVARRVPDDVFDALDGIDPARPAVPPPRGGAPPGAVGPAVRSERPAVAAAGRSRSDKAKSRSPITNAGESPCSPKPKPSSRTLPGMSVQRVVRKPPRSRR